MFLKIAKAIGFALLITSLYIIAANIAYYVFNGETMFHHFHYFAWVQYALGAALMLVGALALEIIRAFTGNK